MQMDNEVIAAIFGSGVPVKSRYIELPKSSTEPPNWPLTRRATSNEWWHVVKAVFVRRVPKTQPICRRKLLTVVADDLRVAASSGRIYVDADVSGFVNTSDVLGKLVVDKVLRFGMSESNAEDGKPGVYSVFRTEFTDEWERLIPKTVKAILAIMPSTDVLDMLVDALIDDES